MAWIVDYESVKEQMEALGMRCLYHNSGAFGFPPGVEIHAAGWVGPEDPTIRPAARALVRPVPKPYEFNLARMATRAWQEHMPGKVWVMPRSHWSYELDFGSRDWMPAVLERIGIDPGMLSTRNNAAAIEFSPGESEPFSHLLQKLLEMLLGSDFALAWPGRPVTCTVHHHKQLWWLSTEAPTIALLRSIEIASAPGS